MTGLFSLAIWVLMFTLCPYAPDYQDRLSSPGVMVWPDTYGEEMVEINYNTSNKNSWMKMGTILHNFLIPYNDTMQACYKHNCTKGKYFVQTQFSAPNHTKWACPFMQSWLGPCSGLEDTTFGYNGSMPCVIIKMNRIINYFPTNYTKTKTPPYVNCTALEGHENIAQMDYYPEGGKYDLSYFPYYGRRAQPTYVNPLVAVQFHLVGKKSAKIQCRVVSEKIDYTNMHDPYEGKVDFYIRAMK